MSRIEEVDGENPQAAAEEVFPSVEMKTRRHSSRSTVRKSAKRRKHSHKASRKRRRRRAHVTGHSEADVLEPEGRTLQTPNGSVCLSTVVKVPTPENNSPPQERHSSNPPKDAPGKSSLGHKAERTQGKEQSALVINGEKKKNGREEESVLVINGEKKDSVASTTGFAQSRHVPAPKCPPTGSPRRDFKAEPGRVASGLVPEQTNAKVMQRDGQLAEVTSPSSTTAPPSPEQVAAPGKNVLMDIGSPDETLLSRTRSFLAFWRLGVSESCNQISPCSESSPRYRFSRSLPNACTSDSHLSKASRTTLFVALLVPWACVVLVALLLVRPHPRTPQLRTTPWVEQMGNACVTDGCLNAVWELTSSIDLTVEPCKNFYGFACGLWGNESSSPIAHHGKRHDSYMSIQRGAYVTAVNLSLLQPPRSPSVAWITTASNMSVVYRSCLRFFGEEPVDFYETMRASGIDFNAWTSVSTFDDLFALAIGHALQYNMTSVLGVRWRDDRGGSEFLDIFTGMSIVQRMGSSSRRRFVIRGLMLIGQYNTLGQIAAVENLDNAITEKVTTPCSSSTPKTEISLTEMDTPRTNWSRAVAEYAELVGRQPPSEALVENISGVRAVLEQLAKAEKLSVAVYLMLSSLAEFFLIEDEVQRQEPVSIDGGERPAMYEACVRTLELLFGEHYRRWVSMHIHKQGITSDVRRIWKVVLAALERFALDRPSTPLDWETVYAVSELETALPDTERRTPHDRIEGTALPSEYSRDFISNIIRFSQKTGAKRRCEPFLTLYSIGMRWSDRETLLRLAVPDFYHPEVTEHVINYATLGYFLAELAIRSALPKNWSSKGYFLCMENYARFHLGLVSSKWHWRQLRERIWAAQVALRAAVMESADLSTRDDLLRLFFLRLARTSCSLAARRRDDAGHISEVATSCNMIAMTAPNFSRAFGCPNLPDVDC